MIALAALVALAAAAPDAPAVKELSRDGVKGLSATFRVDAPPDHVLAVLWDVDRFRAIFPDIKRLEVLARTERSVDARFFVDATLAEVSYTLRRTVDPTKRRIEWRSVAGDVKSIYGSWDVAPDGAGSIVTYTSFVDVGRFVPTALVRDLALGKVEQMAARVRRACIRPPAAAPPPARADDAG